MIQCQLSIPLSTFNPILSYFNDENDPVTDNDICYYSTNLSNDNNTSKSIKTTKNPFEYQLNNPFK